MKQTPLERDIEKHLVRGVVNHNGLCLKWVCPGWAGVPDRIILLPQGRIIFAELKRPTGGRISPLQAEWHRRLEGLGFEVHVVFTHEDVVNLLKRIEVMSW